MKDCIVFRYLQIFMMFFVVYRILMRIKEKEVKVFGVPLKLASHQHKKLLKFPSSNYLQSKVNKIPVQGFFPHMHSISFYLSLSRIILIPRLHCYQAWNPPYIDFPVSFSSFFFCVGYTKFR